MAGFIEQLGDVASKVLTDTLEDPKKREKLLRMGLESLTMPDRTDTSNAAYNLGRFRAISAKQQQEAQARAAALEKEEEYQKEMRKYRFESQQAQTQREFEGKLELAKYFEGKRVENEKFAAAQRKEARTTFNTLMKGDQLPLDYFVDIKAFWGPKNENGTRVINYTPHFASQITLGGVKIPEDATMEKLFLALHERHQAKMRQLNGGKAKDIKGRLEWSGTMLSSMLEIDGKPPAFAFNSIFNEETKKISVPKMFMDAKGSEWLSLFRTTIPNIALDPNKSKKLFGEKSREASKLYIEGMKQAKQDANGLQKPNKFYDNFVKKYLAPLMRQNGAHEFFKYAFKRQKAGHIIEDNEDGIVGGKSKITSYDLNYLKLQPLIARLAIEFGELTEAEYKHILESTPDIPAELTRTVGESKSNNGLENNVVVIHKKSFWPKPLVDEITRINNNINGIKDKDDKRILLDMMEKGKTTYSRMTDRQKQEYHEGINNILQKHETDIMVEGEPTNAYLNFVTSMLMTRATSIRSMENGIQSISTLTKTDQSKYRQRKDGTFTSELTPEFTQRRRMQSQRENIDTKLTGIGALAGMSVRDMRFFGGTQDLDKAAEDLSKQPVMGSSAEILLNLDNLLQTGKEFFQGLQQRIGAQERPFENLYKNNAYVLSQANPGLYQEQNGFNVNMNARNKETMAGLQKVVEKQHNQLVQKFQSVYNKAKSVEDKRAAYLNHLKRAAMLWEKTSLTYQMAGYVQGDQTGGRTISNQDFDNVYRALWGGKFFTGQGARNAVRYLKFMNNEALRRGMAEDILIQATGESFLSESNRNMVNRIFKNNLNVFYSKPGNLAVKHYVESSGIKDNSPSVDTASATFDQVRELNIELATLNRKGLEGFPTNENQIGIYKTHISNSLDAMRELSYYPSNMLKVGYAYKPNDYEMEAYSTIRKAITDETDFGMFLLYNAINSQAMKQNDMQKFPELLRLVSDLTLNISKSMKFFKENERPKRTDLLEGYNRLEFLYLQGMKEE